MITSNTLSHYQKIFFKFFFGFGLPMGVLVGFYQHSFLTGIIYGATGGLVYAAVMIFALGLLNNYTTKKIGVNYSETLLNVHQVEVLRVEGDFDSVFECGRDAILTLPKSKIVRIDHDMGVIEAKVGLSVWSFGEKVLLLVSSDGGNECKVSISSKPVVQTTMIDYGKNVSNMRGVKNFFKSKLPLLSD